MFVRALYETPNNSVYHSLLKTEIHKRFYNNNVFCIFIPQHYLNEKKKKRVFTVTEIDLKSVVLEGRSFAS